MKKLILITTALIFSGLAANACNNSGVALKAKSALQQAKVNDALGTSSKPGSK